MALEDYFEELNYLGRGADGIIWYTCKKDGKTCGVLKEIFRKIGREELSSIDIVKKIDSRFINNQIYSVTNEICTDKNKNIHPRLSGDCHYIFMKKYDGDLYDLLSKRKLKLEDIKSLFWQIRKGLSDIHKYGIVHTDLHCGNIFFTKLKTNMKWGQHYSKYHFFISDFSRYEEKDRFLKRNKLAKHVSLMEYDLRLLKKDVDAFIENLENTFPSEFKHSSI